MATGGGESAIDPQAALQQVIALLKTRNDTSRFVGLSLLRSVLDTNEQLREDPATIQSCWDAISNKFLIRLMSSGTSKTIPSEEAKSMQDLAVAVVHTFANLLPSEQLITKRMLAFVEPLVTLIPGLDPAPQMIAFQTLQSLASFPEGVDALLIINHLEALRTKAVDNERYFKEYLKLYSIAWATENKHQILDELQKALPMIEKTDPSLVLETLAALAEELSFLHEPDCISYVTRLIQLTLTARPSAKARTASIRLASAILQRMPRGSSFAVSLFGGSHVPPKEEAKPFAYVLIQYVLIDLRSTIPSLMANLASPIYTTDALRLAACYDIVSAFILYLIQSMDFDDDITKTSTPSILPPDLLLKLRRDLSETFSLTIEFFRDRWDAITSGAGGLDPSARLDPKGPAMLTWDNPMISPEEDPVILSGLRALSLWIREDDNKQLQKQALDIMDVLLGLYSSSMDANANTDFRLPVLVLLEGLLPAVDEATQVLLDREGWAILARDLDACLVLMTSHTQDLNRVLLLIVESEAVPQSREAWMGVVKSLVENGSAIEKQGSETTAGVLQLAIAIVSKAPKRLQKEFKSELRALQSMVECMLEEDTAINDTRESLEEVDAELSDLLRRL